MRAYFGFLWLWVGVWLVMPVHAQTQPNWNPSVESKEAYTRSVREVDECFRDGRITEGFSKLFLIKGREPFAAEKARRYPTEALQVLAQSRLVDSNPMLWMVWGDAMLALNNRAGALNCYQIYAEKIKLEPVYPVERDMFVSDPWDLDADTIHKKWMFRIGPGSHVDNWLLRRFIYLDALSDAGSEFARVWQLHQSLVGKRQYPFWSLQFVMDYACFLNQTNQTDQALTLVCRVLEQMDLDRYPVPAETDDELITSLLRASFEVGVGLRREDFIRLALRFFQKVGKESEFVAFVDQMVHQRGGPARRIKAQVFNCLQQPQVALQEELNYLEQASFSPGWKKFRQANTLEKWGHLCQAVADYEECLRVPGSVPELDELNEVTGEMIAWNFRLKEPTIRARAFRTKILERLKRFGPLCPGWPAEKHLAVVLELAKIAPEQLKDPRQIKHLEAAFNSANQPNGFKNWANQFVSGQSPVEAATAVAIYINDQPALFDIFARQVEMPGFNSMTLEFWVYQFGQNRPEWRRQLLEYLLKIHPDNKIIKGKLFILNSLQHQDNVVPALESIIETPQLRDRLFPVQIGSTRVENISQVALTLIKQYAQSGEVEKLFALMYQVANGEPPFDRFEANWPNPVHLNQVNLAIGIALNNLKNPAQVTRLQTVYDQLPWRRSKKQSFFTTEVNPTTLPKDWKSGYFLNTHLATIEPGTTSTGPQVLVSFGMVTALCRNDRWMFVGHPWGVAIRDFKGNLVRCLALGEGPRTMVADAQALWVGTSENLFRVDLKTFGAVVVSYEDPTVQALPVHNQDPVSQKSKQRTAFAQVKCLVIQGTRLWIGASDLFALDMGTYALRWFRPDEFPARNASGWEKLFADGDSIWVSRFNECFRYDSRYDRWEAPIEPGDTQLGLMWLIDGQLWAKSVQRNQQLKCFVIDPKSRVAKPVGQDGLSLFNGFDFFGWYQGNPLFGRKVPQYVYNSQTNRLIFLGENPQLEMSELKNGIPPNLPVWGQYDRGDQVVQVGWPTEANAGQVFFSLRNMLTLPDKTLVLAGGDASYSVSGGLWLVPGQKPGPRQVFQPSLGFWVASIVPHEPTKTLWVNTNEGIFVFDHQNKLVMRLGQSDGLISNLVTHGVWVGNQYICICDSADTLFVSVIDPQKTRVITNSRLCEKSNAYRIKSLTPATSGKGVMISFELVGEYRSESSRQVPDPIEFPLGSGDYSEPLHLKNVPVEPSSPKQLQPKLPYLGGTLGGQVQAFGKTYLYGNNGVVLFQNELPVHQKQELVVTLSPAQPFWQQKEAAQMPNVDRLPPQAVLNQLDTENNPYRLAKLMTAKWKDLSAQAELDNRIATLTTSHPSRVVRVAGVNILAALLDPKVIPVLQQAALEKDPEISQQALSWLLQRNVVPDVRVIKRHFLSDRWVSDKEFFLKAAASEADAEVLRLLIDNIDLLEGKNSAEIYRLLSNRLVQNPKLFQEFWFQLLPAIPITPKTVTFVRQVSQSAGKALLPHLHQELRSEDEIARTYAAYSCGIIGDPASIPILEQALQHQSGLSRAAIVRSLVELKAIESIPRLAKLYIQEVLREAGEKKEVVVRYPWSSARYPRVWETLTEVDTIEAEWEMLKSARLGLSIKPESSSLSSKSENIIWAARQMGPTAEQEFYRILAGSRLPKFRLLAAENLTAVSEGEKEATHQILEQLSGDQYQQVMFAAIVSLLNLGDMSAQTKLEKFLEDPYQIDVHGLANQVKRIRDQKLQASVLSHIKATLDNLPEGTINQASLPQLFK